MKPAECFEKIRELGKVCGGCKAQFVCGMFGRSDIGPDPECPICNGTGEVVDLVDYGSTVVRVTSTCECVVFVQEGSMLDV